MNSVFTKATQRAISSLPVSLKTELDRTALVISNENSNLLGLYEGIPKRVRDANESGLIPDKITLFKRSLEKGSHEEKIPLEELIYETLVHEIGHSVGLSERELRKMEKRKPRRKLQS